MSNGNSIVPFLSRAPTPSFQAQDSPDLFIGVEQKEEMCGA